MKREQRLKLIPGNFLLNFKVPAGVESAAHTEIIMKKIWNEYFEQAYEENKRSEYSQSDTHKDYVKYCEFQRYISKNWRKNLGNNND